MKITKIFVIISALVLMLSLASCALNNAPVPSPSPALSEASNPAETSGETSNPAEVQPTPGNDEIEPEEDLSLSGVLYNFTFKLEGDSITLPLTVEEFQSYGWEPKLGLVKNMGSKTTGSAGFAKNGKEVMVSLANMSDESLPIEKCTVYGIMSYYYDDYMSSDDNENYAVIELPKGIVLGVSNISDVLQAFGSPTYKQFTNDTELEQTLKYIYNNETFRSDIRGVSFGIEIWTDTRKDNIVTKIDISNLR